MKNEITKRLGDFTEEIRRKEISVIMNFVEIGKRLKEIRDSKIYKEKYSEFGEYILKSNFKFSERNAYNMILIVEKFSADDCTNLGISKCMELLRLPVEKREEFVKENKIGDMSVRELKQEVDEIVKEPVVEVIEKMEDNPDNLDILDKALDYIFEELDTIEDSFDYKKSYQKEEIKILYQKVIKVSDKLSKIKSILKKVRGKK